MSLLCIFGPSIKERHQKRWKFVYSKHGIRHLARVTLSILIRYLKIIAATDHVALQIIQVHEFRVANFAAHCVYHFRVPITIEEYLIARGHKISDDGS